MTITITRPIEAPADEAPADIDGLDALFQRARVTPRDQAAFVGKLVVVVALGVAGGFLALSGSLPLALCGAILLGAVYTHAVELQHQCLHHTAFLKSWPHRVVGVPLGLPLLVSYSHYRVRHLQHHRFLGTPQDSEFFGFDVRQPVTWQMLLRGLLDYGRVTRVAVDIVRSWRGTWRYDLGQTSDRRTREIMAEYRLMGVMMLLAAGAAAAGFGSAVLWLWLVPLLFAVPMHFLVELPEHILCDTETADVLVNTRSITGSWLTTWFTNGNNLHIEHHAAMTLPINRLRERHRLVRHAGKHVERSYLDFYRQLLDEVRRNGKR